MEDRNDICCKVINIVAAKLDISKDRITESTTFESLGADYLDTIEIIMRLEDLFNIEINDDEADKVLDIQTAVECVQKLK